MIGAGFFAQFHADGWKRVEGARIVAVADTDRDRARAFADQWDIPAIYDDAAGMLDREKPDFADIVTRPETHLALVRMAAERGLHIVCQKPMAPTVDECREMVRLARGAGVRLMIHENWRWQPWYREVKRLIDAGALGRIYHVAFKMRTGDGRGPEPFPAQPYFRAMPRLLIYETAVHFLDTFRFLAGEIASVMCETQRINPAIAGEDYALIQLRFESGARGLIDANRTSGPVPSPLAFGELAVEGGLASVRMDHEGDLYLKHYPGGERLHPFEKPLIGYKGDSARAVQQHIIDCLRSGARAESEGEEYLKTVALVEACYRSAASGAPEAPR
jgi:predicted dehydrogenase